ncbi:Vitamin B12 import system permease protein BtuC [subsurface metagenome]
MGNRVNTIVLFALIVPLIVLLMLDLWLGSVSITFESYVDILTGKSDNSGWNYIIFHLRLPRAVTAVITGAGLSVAGLMMQTLFRNPLAGPYVLGISSGAGLGVALFVMSSSLFSLFSIDRTFFYGIGGQIISAIVGSSIVFLIIISISSSAKYPALRSSTMLMQ